LAFVGFALTVVVISNVAQWVTGRLGVRPTLTTGLLVSALSVGLLTRLPVHGSYFWDLFPAFVLGGAGMGLSFVPVTIASLTGVERADAGVASGLINTSRQIGGAIGLAAVSAIAAASTNGYARSHAGASTAVGLDHGFQTGLYALTGLLVFGALLVITFVRPARPPAAVEPEALALEEAA
jgi:MFS family permease